MKKISSNKSEFDILHHFLQIKSTNSAITSYWVPEILIGGTSPQKLVDVGNPYSFYLHIFSTIENETKNIHKRQFKHLSSKDSIYQCFIRTFASLNGEIGTALKQIAFLPFLKNHLGISVFISLPTGTIGDTNRKGQRGSPFAIKNPFDIDPSFGDHLLPDFSVLFQYKVLVQACRKLDIRVGSVVPLATLSIDSPLFRSYPGLGFWWAANPGELLYCEEQFDDNSFEVDINHEFNPPQISNIDKQRFIPPPSPEDVIPCFVDDQLYFTANVNHQARQQPITLANAFPDVVAGDTNTYTWGDVSPIKYIDQNFPPPMGIRTSDIYDPSQPAWQIMPYLIAWRVRELGEEVFLVDVNQSVPEEILARAQYISDNWQSGHQDIVDAISSIDQDHKKPHRTSDLLIQRNKVDQSNSTHNSPKLHFISEELWNFNSDSDLINTVVGPLIFCVSAHTHNYVLFINSLRHYLQELEKRKGSNFFLAGVSNHDTMPPLPPLTPLLYTTYYFLPKSIPLIFSGTEFYAQAITNKEFGFNTSEELIHLRQQLDDDKLGLFNDRPLDWSTLPRYDDDGQPLIPLYIFLNKLSDLRNQLITLPELDFTFIQSPKNNCFGYRCSNKLCPEDSIIIFINWDIALPTSFSWPYEMAKLILTVNDKDHQGKKVAQNDTLTLSPLSASIFVTGKFRKFFKTRNGENH